MGRKWRVEIEHKEYEVEAKYGVVFTSGAGQVVVNGEVVDVWGSSVGGFPKERVFQVGGRKGVLTRVGLINQNMELFVPGAVVQRVK